MQTLINDLLTFSRVESRSAPLSVIDIGDALNGALSNLSRLVAETHADIAVESSLPKVAADRTQLTQLFQNLVGNAIKFRGPLPPKIEIGAREEDAEWVFWVRDHGIGIEPQYFERIFQIFQRLHTPRQYPGTGIGLAICKRIVERHQGRIWVESEPGEGATFYFTLPRR